MKIDRPRLIIVVSALIVMTGLIVTCIFGIRYYRYARHNFTSRDGEQHEYYIYPGMTPDDLTKMLSAASFFSSNDKSPPPTIKRYSSSALSIRRSCSFRRLTILL